VKSRSANARLRDREVDECQRGKSKRQAGGEITKGKGDNARDSRDVRAGYTYMAIRSSWTSGVARPGVDRVTSQAARTEKIGA
jgi:hypothetical protein